MLFPVMISPLSLRHFFSSDTSISDENMSAPLSKREIEAAISELKSRKPIAWMECMEMLSLGGGETIRWLKSIFDTIWETWSVPRDWHCEYLVPLHKKGRQTICDNYCGIALLSIQSKVFAKAILNWHKPRAKQFLCEGQCGFCHGQGCANQLFSLTSGNQVVRLVG